jgi:hypothetical protein
LVMGLKSAYVFSREEVVRRASSAPKNSLN